MGISYFRFGGLFLRDFDVADGTSNNAGFAGDAVSCLLGCGLVMLEMLADAACLFRYYFFFQPSLGWSEMRDRLSVFHFSAHDSQPRIWFNQATFFMQQSQVHPGTHSAQVAPNGLISFCSLWPPKVHLQRIQIFRTSERQLLV